MAGRSRSFDKVDTAPDTSSVYSHFSSELNSGRLFERAVQSESVPRLENAPSVSQGLPFVPGCTLPDIPARRTSGHNIDATPPFGFPQTLQTIVRIGNSLITSHHHHEACSNMLTVTHTLTGKLALWYLREIVPRSSAPMLRCSHQYIKTCRPHTLHR